MALEAITNGDNNKISNGSRPSDKTTLLGTLIVVRDDYMENHASAALLEGPPSELQRASCAWAMQYTKTVDGAEITSRDENSQAQFVNKVEPILALRTHEVGLLRLSPLSMCFILLSADEPTLYVHVQLATISSVWRAHYNRKPTWFPTLGMNGLADVRSLSLARSYSPLQHLLTLLIFLDLR